jgi:stearoyl-CoA 9-desaturase NADPH oxidoreductase
VTQVEPVQAEDGVLTRVMPKVRPIIDLFATPLTAEHYLELVNPLWSTRRLQARVVDVRDETADSRTLVLKPGRNWRRHKAGQHLRIGLHVDGRRYTRTYSIASSPERPDGLISITVKKHPGGRMSGVLVRDLEIGTHLPIGLPQGSFTLPDAKPVRPLFITAGSGITPVMAMLRTYDLVGNVPDIVHVHYAPHEYDVIFGDELRALAERYPRHYTYLPVHTRELADGGADDRHFSAEQLQDLCGDWSSRHVWACGPQGLLDDVEAHWTDAGLKGRLHTERFRAPMADLTDVEGGTVTFTSADGHETTAVADGETPLLRVAEDAGLNPAHGCRMGICHTCDTPLRGGSVVDLRTGAVIAEEGHMVQTCVSAAKGDCRLDLRT